MTQVTLTIPGASPEDLRRGEEAFKAYFATHGVNPIEARNAAWILERWGEKAAVVDDNGDPLPAPKNLPARRPNDVELYGHWHDGLQAAFEAALQGKAKPLGCDLAIG